MGLTEVQNQLALQPDIYCRHFSDKVNVVLSRQACQNDEWEGLEQYSDQNSWIVHVVVNRLMGCPLTCSHVSLVQCLIPRSLIRHQSGRLLLQIA